MVPTTQAPAVTRAVAILDVLSESREPLGVSAIARKIDLIPSSCLHILRALVESGVVRCDAEKRYSLGPRLLVLAKQLLRRGGFNTVATPSLQLLARDFGVTAIGVRCYGLDPLAVVALAHPDRPWHLHLDIGDVFPALTSASGRCLAAFGGLARADLAEAFGAARWERPPSQREWFAQVDETRRRGYSVDDGYFMQGVIVIGAPVLMTNAPLEYVLTVAGIREQIQSLGIDTVAAALLEVAQRIATQLGSTEEVA
jgi:DNA-binding IclR family transcriptional regulator